MAREREEVKDGERRTTEGAKKGRRFRWTERSSGVLLLAPGHYLAPPPPMLSSSCVTARGSPAHISRGPAVTVLTPKITSANGREAEGTDQ